MTRSRRIARKLHERALGLGVIDASQVAAWRQVLFASPIGVELPIDARHLEGLSAETKRRARLGLTRGRTIGWHLNDARPEGILLG